jgi:hypothetical protein
MPLCPNERMSSDFSAIDAELEELGGGAKIDALALAQSYTAELPTLAAIDSALNDLASEVLGSAELAQASVLQPSGRFLAEPSEPERQVSAPHSEEIVLPEPVSREELAAESREIPLADPEPRSGSFELADESAPERESDVTLELSPEMVRTAPSERTRRNFDVDASEAEDRADSEFDALFVEATRRSSMPGARSLGRDEAVGEDTDIFDTSVLGFDDVERGREPAFGAEELDSGELELVEEEPARPSPSKPPEKRPSFLGRLFGRKEDGP